MKKALATILALVMAIGLCSISWAANPASVSNADELKTAIGAATAVDRKYYADLYTQSCKGRYY